MLTARQVETREEVLPVVTDHEPDELFTRLPAAPAKMPRDEYLQPCLMRNCINNENGICGAYKTVEFESDFDSRDCEDYETDESRCVECGEYLEEIRDWYGSDADGRRGVPVTFMECPKGH